MKYEVEGRTEKSKGNIRMVGVEKHVWQTLKELSSTTGKPMKQIIREAVHEYIQGSLSIDVQVR